MARRHRPSKNPRQALPREPSATARRIRLPYPKDENGKPLCRWCRKPVLPPRKSWCGDACVEEYRERYDTVYQRKLVLRRDRGVCVACRLDTVRLAQDVRAQFKAGDRLGAAQRLVEAGLRATDLRWKARGLIPLWQADHIVPVVEGGGGTGTDNLRTLCLGCHRKVTRDLMARRRAARKAERDAEKAAKGESRKKPDPKPAKPARPKPPAKPTRFKWSGVRPKETPPPK